MPFGVDANGLLVHISQARDRGLACGLSCPECGCPLVARLKEGKRRRHFAHSARGECRFAAESALHRYAKQVIAQQLTLRLPEVRASNGELIYRQREQALDTVRLECRHHGIIPDIIASREGRELLVEIVVTHRCDERKLAVLAERELPTVEIDLSAVDMGNDLSALDEAILRGSDRWWVFHPKIEEASRREAEQAQQKAAQAALDRETAADALAKRIEAWKMDATASSESEAGSSRFFDDVEMCGLASLARGRLNGDWLLREPGAGWQTTLLWLVLSYRKSKTRIVRPVDLAGMIEDEQLLRDGATGLPADVWACAAEMATGLATPVTLAAAFIDKLSQDGLLDESGTLDQERAEAAMQRRAVILDARRVEARRQREEAAIRKAEELREDALRLRNERLLEARIRISQAVQILIAAAGDEGARAFDIEAWWDTPLWDGRTPQKRIEHELDGKDALYAEVVALNALVQPGASPARHLLNLPLNGLQQLRKADYAVRWKGENEPLRRQRVDRLNEFDEDPAWFVTALLDLDGLTPREAAAESDEMYKRVHEIARQRQVSRDRSRRAAAAAPQRTAGHFVGRLREAAEHCYPGRAHLWIDTMHNRLGGRPSEVCRSERDLERCLDQLEVDARMKLPARFRRSR